MVKKRKIFFVVASGGQDTDRHYSDTIKRKRSIEEAAKFLDSEEINDLKKIFDNQNYSVWGGMPGPGNIRSWNNMQPGDYVMIYKHGKIILTAEVAMKVHSPTLAEYFWERGKNNQTWEYIYFLINEVEVDINQSELNKYLGYADNYFPQGFMAVEQKKADKLLSLYGDLISFLQTIQKGEKPEEIDFDKKKEFEGIIEEKVGKTPTIHDEIQWRLIRLGNKAHFNVWVPAQDQGRVYEGQRFKDLVIPEFHETIDVPAYVKNIDTVWKLGLSVKAAFEIEHTTQIFSGILRLSDLRMLAPNSNYPLFIVAERDKKNKVSNQLRRPTFSNDYLKLDKVIKFLSYDKVRNLDESFKNDISGFSTDWLTKEAEILT